MDKLMEILEFYKDTYKVDEPIEDIYRHLVDNNVEVIGDSFYCDVWNDEINGYVLLAGTKDSADMWVLKRIIKLIRQGKPIYSMLNGNANKILPMLDKYGCKIFSREGEVVYIGMNLKDE